MRGFGVLLLVLAIVAGAGGLYVYQVAHKFTVEQVTDDLYVIYGMGGNVGVLKTGKGTVIVDTMTLVSQGSAIMAKARELTGEPVWMVINSHYHLDHTHGNPAFPRGTRVISTERTLYHLEETDAAHFADTPQLLPSETFKDEMRISIGDKNLTLLHPGPAHTDGDLVVLFEEEGVIHMGDLFFNKHYPRIDLEAGGSAQAWPAAIDRVFDTLVFDRVIPGHGALAGHTELRQFQKFIQQVADIGIEARASGLSLEETIKSDSLTEDAGYDPIVMLIPVGLNRESVLESTWKEAHEDFELR
jgi:glyoxylase-like metal-dependent hydrolase (beta-lactamase superfamily II)